jgi:hypothetical protein
MFDLMKSAQLHLDAVTPYDELNVRICLTLLMKLVLQSNNIYADCQPSSYPGQSMEAPAILIFLVSFPSRWQRLLSAWMHATHIVDLSTND